MSRYEAAVRDRIASLKSELASDPGAGKRPLPSLGLGLRLSQDKPILPASAWCARGEEEVMPKGLIKRKVRAARKRYDEAREALGFQLARETDIRRLRRRIESLHIPVLPARRNGSGSRGREFYFRRSAQCLQCCGTLQPSAASFGIRTGLRLRTKRAIYRAITRSNVREFRRFRCGRPYDSMVQR